MWGIGPVVVMLLVALSIWRNRDDPER